MPPADLTSTPAMETRPRRRGGSAPRRVDRPWYGEAHDRPALRGDRRRRRGRGRRRRAHGARRHRRHRARQGTAVRDRRIVLARARVWYQPHESFEDDAGARRLHRGPSSPASTSTARRRCCRWAPSRWPCNEVRLRELQRRCNVTTSWGWRGRMVDAAECVRRCGRSSTPPGWWAGTSPRVKVSRSRCEPSRRRLDARSPGAPVRRRHRGHRHRASRRPRHRGHGWASEVIAADVVVCCAGVWGPTVADRWWD